MPFGAGAFPRAPRVPWLARRVAALMMALTAATGPGPLLSPAPALAAQQCVDGWQPVSLPASLAAMQPFGAAASRRPTGMDRRIGHRQV